MEKPLFVIPAVVSGNPRFDLLLYWIESPFSGEKEIRHLTYWLHSFLGQDPSFWDSFPQLSIRLLEAKYG